MHPIEHLRYIARAAGADNSILVREAASALAALGLDHAGLVTACRRLLEQHAASGPLWWLCARIMVAADARDEAWRCVEELEGDKTARNAGHELPDDSTVCIIGWPDTLHECFAHRGDIDVLLVDTEQGPGFARMLDEMNVGVEDVPAAGMGEAVRCADILMLEPAAMSEQTLIATAGSLPAAAVANQFGTPVWAVAGIGRLAPPRTLAEIGRRVESMGDPWLRGLDVMSTDLIDRAFDRHGAADILELVRRANHPVAEDLFARAQ